MLKKIILIIMSVIMIIPITHAATLEEAVDKAAKRLSIETAVDKNVLRLYKDWGYIDEKYKSSIAGALYTGMLCPEDKMINPKSEDLSPLIKGLVRFGLSSNTFNVIGTHGNPDVKTNPETIYIIGNEILTNYKMDDSGYYYAIVNKSLTAYVIWQSATVKVNWLYKGKLYLQEGNKLILTDAKKSNNELWQDATAGKYTSAALGKGFDVTDININYLDRDVYILGDLINSEIVADYFKIVE